MKSTALSGYEGNELKRPRQDETDRIQSDAQSLNYSQQHRYPEEIAPQHSPSQNTTSTMPSQEILGFPMYCQQDQTQNMPASLSFKSSNIFNMGYYSSDINPAQAAWIPWSEESLLSGDPNMTGKIINCHVTEPINLGLNKSKITGVNAKAGGEVPIFASAAHDNGLLDPISRDSSGISSTLHRFPENLESFLMSTDQATFASPEPGSGTRTATQPVSGATHHKVKNLTEWSRKLSQSFSSEDTTVKSFETRGTHSDAQAHPTKSPQEERMDAYKNKHQAPRNITAKAKGFLSLDSPFTFDFASRGSSEDILNRLVAEPVIKVNITRDVVEEQPSQKLQSKQINPSKEPDCHEQPDQIGKS